MTEPVLEVIDPHLHLFNLQQGEYHWLRPHTLPLWPDKHLIQCNFTQADLTLGSKFKLAGFVHIEAGFDNQQPWREIDWLENHCSRAFKTVAFADISTKVFEQHLDQLRQRQSVVGIRFILDEQAERILSADLTRQHFTLLSQANLSFDAQLSLTDAKASASLVALANQFPDVSIIINHAGWPPAKDLVERRDIWQLSIQKLAECKNIAMKLSGWEMADRAWQPQFASSIIQDCIISFGENRVMLASNFPLCLFSMPYAQLWNTYAALPNISRKTFAKITYSNAKTWYKLKAD